ncbi:MAG: PRC-barrel domain-containing protein [Acidimicrobiia bacterium]
MSRVVRARELLSFPVVTLRGDDVAEVRDVVYDSEHGALLGFTLNQRGLFGGKLRERLSMSSVHAIGHDAVMVASEDELVDVDAASDPVAAASSDRNVIGDAVLTESGTNLGEVVDVIITVGEDARAVGYEVKAEDRTLYIPLPEQHAVSGDALIVPDEVEGFVHDDLAGFGASIPEFRARLHEETSSDEATS